MIRQMQIQLEEEPDSQNRVNHRALRRCHGCGSYARPSAEIDGTIRCERCATKLRREREDEVETATRGNVSFLL